MFIQTILSIIYYFLVSTFIIFIISIISSYNIIITFNSQTYNHGSIYIIKSVKNLEDVIISIRNKYRSK